MNKAKSFGMNKSGIGTAPIMAKEMMDGARRLTNPPDGTEELLAEERTRLTKASSPVGSVPPPSSVKGAVSAGMELISGHDIKMLIDKLGERLAFERSGVRLYDALISKREAENSSDFPLERLEHIRNQELEHFHLVENALRELGADPTAMTPCADVSGVSSIGLVQVATDPRIKFADALHVILVAELTDNAGWELLIRLARDQGQEKMAERFSMALQHEQEHLSTIRDWMERIVLGAKAVESKPLGNASDDRQGDAGRRTA